MQKLTRFFVALVALTACFSAVHASDLDFILINKTGTDLEAVYISASDAKNWGANVLENEDILKEGEELHIKFSPKEDSDNWDIRVVDREKGQSLTWEKIDLTDVNRIKLIVNKSGITAEVE